MLQAVQIVNTEEVWEAYRDSLTDEQDIRDCYIQQLSLPSPSLSSAWKSYQAWEPQKPHIEDKQERYLQVFAHYKKLEPLYVQLARDLSHNAKEVVSAHAIELVSQLPLTAALGVFEQALLSLPSTADLWRAYISYLVVSRQTEKKTCDNDLRKTLKRAVRNCYWEVGFHIDLLLVLETMGKLVDSKRYSEAFATALTSAFPNATDYLALWKAKFDHARRTNSDSSQVIESAGQWLQRYSPGLDISFRLYVAPQLPAVDATTMFETVVKDQGGSYANWYFYAKWLEDHNDLFAMRTVLKRGLEYTKDQVQEMADLYVDMMGKYGTVQEVRAARWKAEKRLRRQQESAPKPPAPPSPPAKAAEPVVKDGRHTAFVKHLSADVREDELKDLFSQVCSVLNVRIVRDLKGRSRGIAYVDLASPEDLTKCVETFNGTALDGHKLMVAVSAPPEKNNKDAKTVFVHNLPFAVSDEELMAEFGRFGKIADLRVIRNAEGLSRGYGYIEYSDESSVQKVLSAGEIQVQERSVKVAQANSAREQATVLHISNLAYDTAEEELKSVFPGVKEVALPRDAEGKGKGFAFVGFETEDDARFALALKDVVMRGRAIVIKKSTREIRPKKSNSDFRQLL